METPPSNRYGQAAQDARLLVDVQIERYLHLSGAGVRESAEWLSTFQLHLVQEIHTHTERAHSDSNCVLRWCARNASKRHLVELGDPLTVRRHLFCRKVPPF